MVGRAELNYPGVALTAPDPWLPVAAAITAIRSETYDTTTYTLSLRDPAVGRAYTYRAGQFNMLGFLGLGEAPISFSSDPGLPGEFEHTIRAVGDVTRAVARMQVGDIVAVRGPFGNPWPMEEARGYDLLFVGGGIGLAPLRSAIEQALRERDRYGAINILYGAKTPPDLVCRADFGRWSAQPDTCLLLTVDRAIDESWPYHVGVVPSLCGAAAFDPARSVALVCGPEIMMHFAALDLLKRGIPPQRLFLSYERRMRCGVAQCGHCFLGPKFVCQDGPVFRYTDLAGLFGKGV